MTTSLNKVTLIGNLGRNPEIRSTSEGKEIATFNLATTEVWKDKMSGDRKEKTEWHRVVVFKDGLVGIIKQYVKKGAKLYIEGQLHTRKWVDANNHERYTTEVILQGFNANLILLEAKTSAPINISNNIVESNGQEFSSNGLDDEIPF